MRAWVGVRVRVRARVRVRVWVRVSVRVRPQPAPHHDETLDQQWDAISLDLVGVGGASQSAVISALDEQLGCLRGASE